MSDKTREQMDLSKLKELASNAIAGRGKNSWVEVTTAREFNVAIEPEDVLALIEVAEKAQTYYTRYAQDEAEDGAMLLRGWSGEQALYSGCSRKQAEDALALRIALSRLSSAGGQG